MKIRTHLIVAIVEIIIYLIIVIPVLPQVITVTNTIIMLSSLIILFFAMVHIAVFVSANNLNSVICISFKRFKSFRNIAERSYSIESKLCAYYRLHDEIPNKLMNNRYNIFIYFRSAIDYLQYWSFRHRIKHFKSIKCDTELYSKYIESVKKDLDDFNSENKTKTGRAVENILCIWRENT